MDGVEFLSPGTGGKPAWVTRTKEGRRISRLESSFKTNDEEGPRKEERRSRHGTLDIHHRICKESGLLAEGTTPAEPRSSNSTFIVLPMPASTCRRRSSSTYGSSVLVRSHGVVRSCGGQSHPANLPTSRSGGMQLRHAACPPGQRTRL